MKFVAHFHYDTYTFYKIQTIQSPLKCTEKTVLKKIFQKAAFFL